MGFQFNHVGGGTKTRRPITLHMKYNSACIQPHCFLITDEFGEQEASLEELQARGCQRQGGAAWRPRAREGPPGAPAWASGCAWVRALPHKPPTCSLLSLPPPPARQDYIENENARLDREAQFWSKEIVVRIEYKFCPNLTIIDTPGARGGGAASWVGGAARGVQGRGVNMCGRRRYRRWHAGAA